jgi:hypothetical protein
MDIKKSYNECKYFDSIKCPNRNNEYMLAVSSSDLKYQDGQKLNIVCNGNESVKANEVCSNCQSFKAE